MNELYRLVYASRNLVQGQEADASTAVGQILDASRRNNAAVDVTGALMFNGAAFAQVLEGPRLGVENTFERIQRDERHGDVTVLQCGPVEKRGFTNWSMAFVGQSARGLALWSTLAADSGFDISRMDGDGVFSMLHDLVLEEEGMNGAQQSVLPAAAPPVEADVTTSERCKATDVKSQAMAEPSASLGSGAAAIVALVQMALADERSRAASLQAEIDVLRTELAAECERTAMLKRERDLWAGRAEALATMMAKEAANTKPRGKQRDGSSTAAGTALRSVA